MVNYLKESENEIEEWGWPWCRRRRWHEQESWWWWWWGVISQYVGLRSQYICLYVSTSVVGLVPYKRIKRRERICNPIYMETGVGCIAWTPWLALYTHKVILHRERTKQEQYLFKKYVNQQNHIWFTRLCKSCPESLACHFSKVNTKSYVILLVLVFF